jgi:hypothetical protein
MSLSSIGPTSKPPVVKDEETAARTESGSSGKVLEERVSQLPRHATLVATKVAETVSRDDRVWTRHSPEGKEPSSVSTEVQDVMVRLDSEVNDIAPTIDASRDAPTHPSDIEGDFAFEERIEERSRDYRTMGFISFGATVAAGAGIVLTKVWPEIASWGEPLFGTAFVVGGLLMGLFAMMYLSLSERENRAEAAVELQQVRAGLAPAIESQLATSESQRVKTE